MVTSVENLYLDIYIQAGLRVGKATCTVYAVEA